MLEAGRPDAPAIILVHGLNSSADVWQPFIPSLSKKLHVIALDLPGFGESGRGNKLYSPDNYVAVIHYLADRLHLHRFMLAGHSLGGNIALRYAQLHPSQIRRLILIDAAGILHRLAYTEYLTHFGIRVLPAFYPQQRHDLTSLAKNLFDAMTDYSFALDVGERYMLSQPDLRREFLGGEPPAIAAYAMALTNFSGVLNNFSIPTLLLWGGQDHVAPLRTAHMLAANFENAGLIVLPDAGHSPLHDDPAQVQDWLLKFTQSDTSGSNHLLATHRYQLNYQKPITSNRVGRCQGAMHKIFSGDYRRLVIEHCRDVQLRNLRARQIRIKDSVVRIDNCELQSRGTSLTVVHSSLTVTACHITGNPAIVTAGSKLDIAGSHLRSVQNAIFADTHGAASTVLFSISELDSQGQRHFAHGPLKLRSGQGL